MDTKAEITAAQIALSGQGAVPSRDDFARAAEGFSRAQSVPYAKAKLATLTALGCGTVQDNDKASVLFFEAVKTGFPPLLRDAAIIVESMGSSPGLVRALLTAAAKAGDWLASELLRHCEAAEPTPIQLAVIETAIQTIFSSPQSFDWQIHCKAPHIQSTSLLTSLQCAYLRTISAPLMVPSKVVANGSSEPAGFRTSDGAVILPAHMDMPLVQILWRLSAAVGAGPEQGEFLSLLRYHPGQEYRPHHDYLPEDETDYSAVKRAGQRSHTLLTYLNEGYSGGVTAFPKLGIRYKGGVGDSLMFENIDEGGKPLPDSLHAGEPVQQGEKWLATLWIRERRFWSW